MKRRAVLALALLTLLSRSTTGAADAGGAGADAPGAGTPEAAADLASWVGLQRTARRLRPLRQDAILAETAAGYAGELAAAGRISHRGADGSDALTRYLRTGGTSARVGEIIGAGTSLAEVKGAWLGSPSHRAVVLAPYWTHTGWGEARSGSSHVWVVLFLQRRVAGLTVDMQGGELRVAGTLLAEEAAEPVLIAGMERIPPAAWDPRGRRFSFLLDPGQASGYVRLGYLSRSGALVVTDVLTSPRGRGFPGGKVRF